MQPNISYVYLGVTFSARSSKDLMTGATKDKLTIGYFSQTYQSWITTEHG